MAIDTQDQAGCDDNRMLWTIVAIIVLAILAYAAYSAYYRGDNYGSSSGNAVINGATNTQNQ